MQKITSKQDLEKLRKSIISQINPALPTITLCGGTGCGALGSQRVYEAFASEIKKHRLQKKVVLKRTGCHGFCERGPIVVIFPQEIFYQRVEPADVPVIIRKTIIKNEIVKKLLYVDPATGERVVKESDVPFYKHQMRLVFRHNGKIDPIDIHDYIRYDGYQALAKVLYKMSPEKATEEVKKSGLRGRGGAGFPTGVKWEFARKSAEKERYVICNGDEGDPGAFMDRSVMEGDPYAVIEGLTIAGYAIGAKKGYIYVRAEYPLAVNNLTIAIKKATEMGLLGKNILGKRFDFEIIIKQGAGAFVCGEETALIASIEGKRGMPRPRPPFPATSGLWEKPTVINNVETLVNLPLILLKGADWYANIGTEGSKGTKIFALAGKINNTGLVEVPMGTTLRQIIEEIGGGIPKGKKFKAVQMGGPSGGCVPAEQLDLPIDYESLKSAGAIMGSGGMVVMDETTCMVDIARYFLDFVQKESCGKCVPCRVGSKRMLEILTRISSGQGQEEDITKLSQLGEMVKETSLCGLGQTAPNPVLSTLRYFKDEYYEHIRENYCRASACEVLVKSPCQNTCAASLNVPQYIELIEQKQYLRSLNLIRRRMPFGLICGKVCFHPCETFCRRGEIDQAIAIRDLKRFAAEHTYHKQDLFPFNSPEVFDSKKKTGHKVAIIGSGPAGLTAAYFLRIMGHDVTVLEAEKVAGGMLMLGIPAYRLPKDDVQREIQLIRDMGVKIKFNSAVRTSNQWDALFKQGFKAVFISIGAYQGRKLGVPGENLKGVFDGIEFLKEVNLGKRKTISQRVVVVGGGNTAIDSARSALRLGAKEVTIIYRRSVEEMPAHKVEINDALNEGVKIEYLVAPVAIKGEKGKMSGVECIRMRLDKADKTGRRRPVPVKDTNFLLEADSIITAISQSSDFSFLNKARNSLEFSNGWLKIDKISLATSRAGVYAGGDCVSDNGSVVLAIGQGQQAAVSIDKYLGGEGKLPENIDPVLTYTTDLAGPGEPTKGNRRKSICLPLSKRRHNFKEIEQGFKEKDAVLEAARCLRCDLEK